LERLTSRYPFNRAATDEVDVSALTATFGPEGAFWAEFEAFIAPAAERVGGRWRGRGASGVRVRLPSDLPDTVASLEALRAALWDEKGEPRPIPLRVRSCALPPVALEGYVATEARLSIGFSQVRAYNQRAEALELPFDWWRAPEASLSLSLQSLNQAEASARPLTTTGGASRWAVLRLLDRSAPSDDPRCPDGLAWSWSRVSGDPAASVGFVFETDPRAVFNIQLTDDAVGGAP
jgi:type VI protein secretion system component VasK